MIRTRSHAVRAAIVLLATVLAASWWTRASTAPLTRDGLASTFDADLRHVVYVWDPADPRPESVRKQALFDFIYETYDASAWIPQSLFDSNVVTQAVVGDVDTIVRDKVGLVLWPDNVRVKAFGMAPNTNGGESLRWTVNCLV